jgi:hypothetical protein
LSTIIAFSGEHNDYIVVAEDLATIQELLAEADSGNGYVPVDPACEGAPEALSDSTGSGQREPGRLRQATRGRRVHRQNT